MEEGINGPKGNVCEVLQAVSCLVLGLSSRSVAPVILESCTKGKSTLSGLCWLVRAGSQCYVHLGADPVPLC